MSEPQRKTSYVRSTCPSIPGMKRFSHEAMATTFEVIVIHEDDRYARQAAAAAFCEVDRLEAELSRFIENSDIARINNAPANRPVKVGLDCFECLRLACQMYARTDRVFDITIGSLFDCWHGEEGAPRAPSEEELNLARARTGAHLLQLDEAEHSVTLLSAPLHVDLGGIGKGYAVDRVAELLREWSIDVALIHGGYSSVLALDAPPGMKGWPLTLSHPDEHSRILAWPHLRCRALSGSGRQKGRHIIDPRTGLPVTARVAAWSSSPDATTADALSTAFMIMSTDEIKRYCSHHPDVLGMVIGDESEEEASQDGILRYGPWQEQLLTQ